MSHKETKEEKEYKKNLESILCVYCSAPWTKDMLKAYSHGGGCDTCGYGEMIKITIDCHKCHKTIYTKEYYPNG